MRLSSGDTVRRDSQKVGPEISRLIPPELSPARLYRARRAVTGVVTARTRRRVLRIPCSHRIRQWNRQWLPASRRSSKFTPHTVVESPNDPAAKVTARFTPHARAHETFTVRGLMPARPARHCLVTGFCSSTRGFALRFFRPSPRGRGLRSMSQQRGTVMPVGQLSRLRAGALPGPPPPNV